MDGTRKWENGGNKEGRKEGKKGAVRFIGEGYGVMVSSIYQHARHRQNEAVLDLNDFPVAEMTLDTTSEEKTRTRDLTHATLRSFPPPSFFFLLLFLLSPHSLTHHLPASLLPSLPLSLSLHLPSSLSLPFPTTFLAPFSFHSTPRLPEYCWTKTSNRLCTQRHPTQLRLSLGQQPNEIMPIRN